MNIIEACKSGKKFRRPCWAKGYYCELHIDGRLISQNGNAICIDKERLLATDYELYEDGIRPKEAGELWGYRSHEKYMTFLKGNNETLWARNITLGTEHVLDGVIHGQEGWQRIHPPVEDERVEIVGIKQDGFTDKLITEKGDLITDWKFKGKLIFLTNKGEG